MKKLLILALSIILLLSVFTISACGKGSGETSSSFFRSIEESATKTKKSRNPNAGLPSQTINDSTTPTPSGAPGQSQSTPSSNAPVVPVGDTFYIQQASESDPRVTSTNAKLVIMQINFIESVSPSNFREKIELIDSAYELYNALPAGEKSQVLNYSSLEGAKAHYLKLQAAAVVIEFEELVGRTIPDVSVLKNADVDNVYKAKDMLEQNKTAIQAMPNFNELNTKLTACYNKVISSIVERAYITQDKDGNGVLDATEQQGGSGTRRQDNGDGFFNVPANGSGSSQGDGPSYTDLKNKTPIVLKQILKCKSEIWFNAPCSGTLVFYARNQSGKTYDICVDGQPVTGSPFKTTTSGSTSTFTVEIPKAGRVTIMEQGEDTSLFAMKFSYPNLG